MKKYLAKTWSDIIEVVEIERESANSVWLNGNQRKLKTSDGKWYRDTPEGAKLCIVDYYRKIVASKEDAVKSYKKELVKAEALEIPETGKAG